MECGFDGIYHGVTAMVTGHTGFKGSWLSVWLKALGANVIGYAPPPPTTPSHFSLANLGRMLTHVEGDLRDSEAIERAIRTYQPDIIFHLGAQSLVLPSYEDPKSTFDINVGGTVNVLEACRHVPSVRAVVCVTSDKCYENQEWLWGYRENDRLGGGDPYSASKAMAELAVESYRRSFFAEGPALASARAGNVIGGGDFSPHRLIPDVVRALIAREPVPLRNASGVRPWLFVLEPLAGYLALGARLLQEGSAFAEAWNFGPQEPEGISVRRVVEAAIETWGEGRWVDESADKPAGHEMGLLRLNWDKAATRLGWRPVYTWHEAVTETVRWYRSWQSGASLQTLTRETIVRYLDKLEEHNPGWLVERVETQL